MVENEDVRKEERKKGTEFEFSHSNSNKNQ